ARARTASTSLARSAVVCCAAAKALQHISAADDMAPARTRFMTALSPCSHLKRPSFPIVVAQCYDGRRSPRPKLNQLASPPQTRERRASHAAAAAAIWAPSAPTIHVARLGHMTTATTARQGARSWWRQYGKDHMQKVHKTNPEGRGRIRNICVYCGSNVGTNPRYAETARTLGALMAGERVGLVYGGGGVGLMGELARSVQMHGGRVTGIIPAFLSRKERMLRDVDELIVVEDMHQRKKLMFDKSDAFVALPGGIGTLEELVEQLTWAQLGRHAKPIVLVNVDGFWEPLLALLRHMHSEAFIRQDMDVRFTTVAGPEEVIPAVRAATRARQQPQAAEAVSDKF